jgi:hypothetical protein
MSGVDPFDQYRSKNPMAQRECCVPMGIFTFLLDASAQNTFAIQKSIDQSSYDFRE